jgi:hypothetical protein
MLHAPPPPRFACHWESVAQISSVMHMHFPNSCMAMPHLAHMAFAVVVTIVFVLTCLGLVSRGRRLGHS